MSTPPYPLASVQDTDSILSFAPLVLGRRPGVYRYGAQAVLARCLYAAMLPRGSLLYDPAFGCGVMLLPGASLAPQQVSSLEGEILKAWLAEDYVQSSTTCTVSFAAGLLTITGAIALVDGNTYPLELLLSSAGAALDALGGAGS
jgi:hypothetical protein